MMNPQSIHNEGAAGENSSSSNPSMKNHQQTKRKHHVISAASSVASSNSSSSSKLSSLPTSTGTTTMGGMAGGSDAIKSLMQQHGPAQNKDVPEETKKEANDKSSTKTAKEAVQVTDASSSTSTSSSVTAPGRRDSSGSMVLPMAGGAPPHPVAEFLFQLTKMLTDNNTKYIEWRNASIFVHDPPGMEKEILPKYFRHSNYSSFQRQMNYFGFRKIAGKGKMSPCSFVNENATKDISSLLFIRRKKTGVSSAAAKLLAQQNLISRSTVDGFGQNIVSNTGMTGDSRMNFTGGGAVAAGPPFANGATNICPSQARITVPSDNTNFSAAAMMPPMPEGSLNQQASIIREQQLALAQLQQAHASALNNANRGGGGGAGLQGGNFQGSAQNNNQPNHNNGMSNGDTNTGFLTNEQGGIYMNNNKTNTNPQSLLIQQAAVNGFPQAVGLGSRSGSSDNLQRIDSAASLRALLNQHISMFNGPGDTNANFGTGMVQGQGSFPQQQGVVPPAGNSNQAFDWNEILQQAAFDTSGIGVGGGGDTHALQQLQQQLLLQCNNNSSVGVPNNAIVGGQHSFNNMVGVPNNTQQPSNNMNGFFSAGAPGSQGF